MVKLVGSALAVLLPWERGTVGRADPSAARLIRGTRRQRLGLIVSAAVLVVAGSAFAIVAALGDDRSPDWIVLVSGLLFMSAFFYLCGVAQIFVQPSVMVLGPDELVATSIFGTRRRSLAAMTGVHRTNVSRIQARGFRSLGRSITYRLMFEEGRPLVLRVPTDDYDTRQFVGEVGRRWAPVRRADVHRRLSSGDTVSIRKAFVSSDGRHIYLYGSVSLSPSGVVFREYRKRQIDLRWDEIAQVGVGEDGQLSILTTDERGNVGIERLIAPSMVAANIADHRAASIVTTRPTENR